MVFHASSRLYGLINLTFNESCIDKEVDDGIKLSLMEGTKFFTEPNSKRR